MCKDASNAASTLPFKRLWSCAACRRTRQRSDVVIMQVVLCRCSVAERWCAGVFLGQRLDAFGQRLDAFGQRLDAFGQGLDAFAQAVPLWRILGILFGRFVCVFSECFYEAFV